MRRKFWVFCVLAVLCCAFAARVVFHSYTSEYSTFHPDRGHVSLPANFPFRVKDISFTAQGTRIAGWFVAPKNHAAIIFAHGSSADRSSLLPEAEILIERGYGALLYDAPGHGESEGRVQYDELERQALSEAVNWLEHESSASSDPVKLGVLGFSMGAYTALQVAAKDKRVLAAALEGTPADLHAQTEFEYRKWGFLSQWPALYVTRQAGVDFEHQQPKDVVDQIAPRALLLIQGTKDDVVSPQMASDLYAHAKEPKEIFWVEDAKHGDYLAVEPARYSRKLIEFFGHTLL